MQFWLINNKLCSLSDRYKQGITIRSQHFALSVLKYKKIELFKICRHYIKTGLDLLTMLWTTKVLRNKIINEQQQPIILGQVVKDDNYWILQHVTFDRVDT